MATPFILGPAAVVPMGVYNPGTEYLRGNVVTFEVSAGGIAYTQSYMARDTVQGVSPTNLAYWQPVADVSDAVAKLGENTQIIREKTGYGVASGLQANSQGSPNMSVSVGAGVCYKADGTRIAYDSAATLAVNAAHATNPRIDIVYVSSSGVRAYLAGTPATVPAAPTVPSGGIMLATIGVPAGTTVIAGYMITDRRKSLWVEDWIYPTLISGFTGTLALQKDITGRVSMFFDLTAGNGTYNIVVCTLPTGYSPRVMTIVLARVVSTGNPGYLYVQSSDRTLRVNTGIATGNQITGSIVYSV